MTGSYNRLAVLAVVSLAAGWTKSITALPAGEDSGPVSPDSWPQLSDEDLTAIMQSPIGPSDYERPARTIGYRGQAPVRLKVFCGDVCPTQSVRIVDLAVDVHDCIVPR